MIRQLRKELKQNPEKAQILQGFFKTKKGEYGEGDVFLGISVPDLRAISKKFWMQLSPKDIQQLLNSKIHEERLIALLCLIEKYKIADSEKKKNIFNFYLKNLNQGNINNWDLVDLSAPNIVGNFLLDNEEKRNTLYLLANSGDLWKKRVAVVATIAFIRGKDFNDTFKIAEVLINDEHDLIHKAVGWMLREVGKKDKKVLIKFLNKNYSQMPRMMLRYAIEKFDERERKKYLR